MVLYPMASGNTHVEEHVSVQMNFHRRARSAGAVPDKARVSAPLADRGCQPASGKVTSRFSAFLVGLCISWDYEGESQVFSYLAGSRHLPISAVT